MANSMPVYKPKHKVPSGYADNLGGGKPGRPGSNQIRTTIRARLYGTSVAPSDNSKGAKPNRQGTPVKTPSGRAPKGYDNMGSNAGRSHPAANSRPKSRKVVRSQVAG